MSALVQVERSSRQGVTATTAVLPEWPARTIAILVTTDDTPHAIPVSAPVRADDQAVLLSLHHTRDSLARLRARPEVALVALAGGNVAFTARGVAHVVAEAMPDAPDYAAVRIDVTDVDDHRHGAFTVDAGVARTWIDEREKGALGERVATLERLATTEKGPRAR